MDVVFLTARILFSAIFLLSAVGHVTQANQMAQYAAYKKAPGGTAGVILTGVLMLLGGLSILFGVFGELGSLLIVAALLPITFFMHAFWKESDPQAKQTEQISFNKNVALIGAALAFFVLFATPAVDVGITITRNLITL
ncbi:MAG: DoxX family protein [Candidatus Nanopelagicales bacterium]